ncbi:MAG: PLD nuclease N-terminal domain-containing protein [Gammaproteobacteria bacterium]
MRLWTINQVENAMDLIGIGSLIILIADIYVIVMILQSSAKSIEKLICSLVVFFLPVIGLIIWYLAGPGKKPF